LKGALSSEELILRLVDLYNRSQGRQFEITRWPDKENRRTRDIDAYAEEPNVRSLAIEHTNVETFANQKLDSSRFMRICGQLEAELRESFDGDVTMTIDTFAIQPGTEWDNIRDALRDWLIENVPKLPADELRRHTIAGVPFPIEIERIDSPVRFFSVMRVAPEGYKRQLIEMMKAALTDKNDQFAGYKKSGEQTLLLMESDDLALVNWSILYMAFLQAQRAVCVPNIEQVWLARTHRHDSWIRCFHASEEIMANANPPRALIGPKYAQHWERGIQEKWR
jgi:hypothetical protein